jgi:predicted TIM-barrel fold metal-dependent hydrolase
MSGAYMYSSAGAEGNYADRNAVGRALIRFAPERMVWGSDWPHTTEPRESVNDAQLLNLLYSWCNDSSEFKKILTDNPQKLYNF